jgi:hypothetical protein
VDLRIWQKRKIELWSCWQVENADQQSENPALSPLTNRIVEFTNKTMQLGNIGKLGCGLGMSLSNHKKTRHHKHEPK